MEQIGSEFGRYKIESLIGEGAMARVYKAYDPRTDRHVALKILKEAWRGDEELMRRFLREAKAAGALSHPNIVAIFDVDHDGPAPYIVMELVDGQSLAQHLREHGRMPFKDAGRVIAQLSRALDFAHARGRVHRDIKPSNILLGLNGIPKLGDFGIARIEDADATRMHDGASQTLGTPRYMSPEQVLGIELDGRSDLFSLGTTFYEMLTGERAFQADNAFALATQIRESHPAAIRERTPEVSDAIAQVVDRMMAKNADQRFQTGNELAASLETALTAPVEQIKPIRRGERPKPQPRPRQSQKGKKSSMPTLVVLVLLLIGGGLAALYFMPIDQEPGPVPLPKQVDRTPPEDDPSPAPPDSDPIPTPDPDPIPDHAQTGELPSGEQGFRILADAVGEIACTRIEMEPSESGLYIVGSTGSALDMATIGTLAQQIPDLNSLDITVQTDDVPFCQTYDILAAHTDLNFPRMANLEPPRSDYQLSEGNALIVNVTSPPFPSYVTVDYFTADGNVAHLYPKTAQSVLSPPNGEIIVGNPLERPWLKISAPFGHELLLIIAARTPLTLGDRPRVEDAKDYLEDLAGALSAPDADRPIASTIAILTVASP